MDPTSAVGTAYSVQVEKLTQNNQKVQGKAAVALIEQAADAAPPPVGLEGQGTHINTYA